MEYDKTFWREFIELYREKSCLWDVKCKDYSNKNKRCASYEALQNKLKEINPNASIDYVKKKINNLRTTFRKELRKVQESIQTGAGSERVYEPNLWYYELLLFTVQSESARKEKLNNDDIDEDDGEIIPKTYNNNPKTYGTMSNEQFSLCWDDFHKNMSSGVKSLLASEDLVDVTLAIEGQYLKAHKMILSVCSPYFRTLFSVTPCKHPIVFMKDISYSVMTDLLTFMYQGQVQVSQENLSTFIKTAEALQIKGLTGDNKNVEDVKQELKTKRPAPTEESIRKHPSQNTMKKTKLSLPCEEIESMVPPLDNTVEIKPEFVSTSNIYDNPIDIKTEPYDSTLEDEANDNSFVDGQAAEDYEEGYDFGHDYVMEGEEEPQPGTSGDGTMADSQDSPMNHGEDFHKELNPPISTKHKNVNLQNYERTLLTCSQPYDPKLSEGGPNTVTSKENSSPLHYLGSIPPTRKKSNPTRPCRICAKKSRRRESRYQCMVCAERPALCIDNCFKIYHQS